MVTIPHIHKYIILALVPMSWASSAMASLPETNLPSIFDSNVKSLSVRNPDNFMAPPVVRLGSDDRLTVNFDILGDAHDYLRYRLLHCNADWTPSRLLESEYLDGFNEAGVDDYAYSSNTFTHYVNYNIEIPNPDMTPLKSGNYLLQVYREDDPDSLILQTRFSVNENIAGIEGEASPRTDKGFNTEWQQVNFSVDLSGLTGINPYQDLIVTVTQNNRPESTRTVVHPLRVDGNKAIFQHNPSLIFGAGNEYRRFETVRADNPGMHADSVAFIGNNWHSFLSPDEPRLNKPYIYDRTQHGRFLIDEYNASEPDLGADYVTVHFYLDAPYTPGADIYVDGDFSLHVLNETNRMRYDHAERIYKTEIPLKQGSYNYQYTVRMKDGNADPSPIEGNFHETSNEYLVNVFLRSPGARADRLIGSFLIE